MNRVVLILLGVTLLGASDDGGRSSGIRWLYPGWSLTLVECRNSRRVVVKPELDLNCDEDGSNARGWTGACLTSATLSLRGCQTVEEPVRVGLYTPAYAVAVVHGADELDVAYVGSIVPCELLAKLWNGRLVDVDGKGEGES
jgi:hypothetical protein